MTRKDGLLALLVVVVWGLNFVVIKLGLHNMPPLMLAGLRFMLVAFPALLFVARPAIPLRLLLGYGLTISFGQFAFLFCAIGLGMPAGLASLVLQAQAFLPSFLAPSSLANAYRASSWRGSRWRSSACWCWWRSLGGEHVPLVGFMLTLAAALGWACGNNFQQKNHVPGDPPANHIAGGVERIDPGAAVYVCLVADRWPAAHAGESTPDRYADGSLAALRRLSPPRRLWYLGLAAGAL